MAWFIGKPATALLALVLSLAGSVSFAATAEEAVKGCKGYPDVEWPRNCQSYFLTILDYIESEDPTLNPEGPLCVAEDLPLSEIISRVIVWIENNPDQKNTPLFDATHKALSAEFKCQ